MLCISKPCHCTTLLYFGWLSALCSFNNLRDGNFWGQPEQGYWEGHSRCFRWERSLSSLPTFWPQCPQWSTSPLLKQSVRKISIYFKKDLIQPCLVFWCFWSFHALSAWNLHGNWHRKSPPSPGRTCSPTSASSPMWSPSPAFCSWWCLIYLQGWIKIPLAVYLENEVKLFTPNPLKIGTLESKQGPNGNQNCEMGPHRDLIPEIMTLLVTV